MVHSLGCIHFTRDKLQVICVTLIDLATAFSAMVAALSFVYGVHAWKREFVGRRRIELAESTLAHFYEAAAAIQAIRNPFSSSGEGKTRERASGESPEESALLDQAFVVFERFDARKELFAELRSLKYRFMATFGKESSQPFDDLHSAVNKIFISARILGQHYWPRQGRVPMSEEQFRTHLDDMEKHERVFWDHGGGDDEIRKQVDEAIKKVELITQKAMNARPGFLSRW